MSSFASILPQATRQREVLRRAPNFRLLLFARVGSGVGTYLATVALQIDVFDRTHSGLWISALLIAEFLPVILIGVLLGPLLDRWPRKAMMVTADLVNVAIFVSLAFSSNASEIVGLAFLSGIANGFFRPIVYAGLPNLVEQGDLPTASSLLQTIESLTMLIGPPLGGLLVAVSNPHVNYLINAGSFLVSVMFVARIPRAGLQRAQTASQGHWRDLAAGMAIVRRSPELRAVLITWPIFNLAAAGINVAEVVLVKQVFHGGDVGFGVLVGSVGLGLVIGSFVSSQVIARIGLAATYSGSIALLGVGVGAAALSPDVWVASGFAVLFGIGNGAAVVCNFLLIARGAPDNLRGRAVVLLMSVGSSSLFLGMVVAGQFTDIVGARWVWGGAAIIALVAAFVGFRLVRRVPEKRGAELPEAPSIGTSPVAGLEETSRP